MTFNSDLLQFMRERRGFTKTFLARKAGVSVRALQQYENEGIEPRDDILTKLSETLSIDPSFFYGESFERAGKGAVSFRAATRLPVKDRKTAESFVSYAIALRKYMAEKFELPKVSIPILDGVAPEVAADTVRSHWGLGNQPAPNMIHLLESKGIFVVAVPEETKHLDAFSFWHEGNPIVCISQAKTAERSRLDLGHELGHLVLHKGLENVAKDEEDQAQLFGASFLLPREAVISMGMRSPSIESVLATKKKWSVSAILFVKRLFDVHLMNDWHYRSLMIELTRRGYRNGEPGGIQREKSQLLEKVMKALRNDGIKMKELASYLHVPEDDLQQMLYGLIFMAVDSTDASNFAELQSDERIEFLT